MKKAFLLFGFCAAVLTLDSCYGDPDPGVGIVIVLDAQAFRVPGAQVRLSQEGQTGAGIILNQGYSDFNGEYAYEHTDPNNGMALEVILDVAADKDGKHGEGMIRIKPNETSTEEVTIY